MPEITNDIEIRYKWYKMTVSNEGDYYPQKDIQEGDIIDANNVIYGSSSLYQAEYCSLSSEYYQKEEKYTREYKKVSTVGYATIENINYNNNVKIYYDKQEIQFIIMSNKNNTLKINLINPRNVDKLLFFIDSDTDYKIALYKDLGCKKAIISKNVENSKIAIPDKTWINNNTQYTTYTTTDKISDSDFITLISETRSCSYKEKYVYKYDVIKEYYDDNYHTYIDGYVKDVNDYKIFYTGEPITNTVEIITEKIIKEPKIEYVYIENETQNNDSSQDIQCSPEIITKIKTETVEKQVFKTSPIMYILIFILTLTIVILTIKLYKKYVV